MKKNKCIICLKAKGKRSCKINNNELVCPVCCAKQRNIECEGCNFYSQSQKFEEQKELKKLQENEFFLPFDSETDAQLEHATDLVERNQLSAAEKIIFPILEKQPQNHNAHLTAAFFYANQKNPEKAIPYYLETIKLHPQNIWAYFNLASTYMHQNDINNSLKMYLEVIKIGHRDNEMVQKALRVLNSMREQLREDCGLSLEEYIELGDYFEEAYLKMRDQESAEAIKMFQYIISKNPKHVQSYGNIGLCYANLGEKEKALMALDKALDLDPDYKVASTNRLLIEKMAEGEKFSFEKSKEVRYYQDKA